MEEIEEYVRKCQLNKVLRAKNKAPMETTTTASHPFEKCRLDILRPLVETESGNNYILTLQDELSKFIVATPLPKQDAGPVAKEFVLNIVLKFGAPAKILTNQGSNFVRNFFKNVCKLLRIRKMQTTAFHLEFKGRLEINLKSSDGVPPILGTRG
jgi:hypothetical protein